MRILVLTAAVGLFLAGGATASDGCSQPGCCDEVQECCGRCGGKTVCQIVCEMKKVKKTVWTYECEEFCPLLPGCGPLGHLGCNECCSSQCGDDCGECGSCGTDACCGKDPCASLRRPMHPPQCGKVRTRKTLVKKQIVCEVPVYKTIVVCAGGCGECSAAAATAEAAPVPQRPVLTAAPLPPVVRSGIAR